MPPPPEGVGDAAADADLKKRIRWIVGFQYKTVQSLASERGLPANLKKQEMAELIALHDAGAKVEMTQMLSSLKEGRSRSRRMIMAQQHYSSQGYVTAEADSASASPRTASQDEDDFVGPLYEDEDDEDYLPSKAKRPRPAKQLQPAGRYGMLSPNQQDLSPAAHSVILSPRTPGTPGPLQALPAAASHSWPEEPFKRKVPTKRAAATGTGSASRNRVTQHTTARAAVAPPRRESGLKHAKQVLSSPSNVLYPIPKVRSSGQQPSWATKGIRFEQTAPSAADGFRQTHPSQDSSNLLPFALDSGSSVCPSGGLSYPDSSQGKFYNPNSGLEKILNIKSDKIIQPVPLMPYWKPANTNCVDCYPTPISFSCSSTSALLYGVTPTFTKPMQYSPFVTSNSPSIAASPLHSAPKPMDLPLQPLAYSYTPVAEGNSRMGPPQEQAPAQPTMWNAAPDQPGSAFTNPSLLQTHGNYYHDRQQSESQKQQQLLEYHQKQQKCKQFKMQQEQLMLQHRRKRHEKWIHSQTESTPQPQPPAVSTHHDDMQYKYQQVKLQQREINRDHLSRHSQQPVYEQQPVVQQDASYALQQSDPKTYYQPVQEDPNQQQYYQHQQVDAKFGYPLQESVQHPEFPSLVTVEGKSIDMRQSVVKHSSTYDYQQTNHPALNYPDFRGQNNQLSYPLIYDFLKSAENQVPAMGNTQEKNQGTDTVLKQASISVSIIEEEILPTISQYLNNSKIQELAKQNDNFCIEPSINTMNTTIPEPAVCDYVLPCSPEEEQEGRSNCAAEPLPLLDGGNPVSVITTSGSEANQDLQIPGKEIVTSTEHCVPQTKCGVAGSSPNRRNSSTSPIVVQEIDSVPITSEINTNLEKVVRKDKNSNEVVFLCNDGMGDFEYMTLNVSLDENPFKMKTVEATQPLTTSTSNCPKQNDNESSVLNTSFELSETLPMSPSTSDIVNDEENILMSPEAAGPLRQPSIASTIPLTNSNASTEKLTSISDYLSNSVSAPAVVLNPTTSECESSNSPCSDPEQSKSLTSTLSVEDGTCRTLNNDQSQLHSDDEISEEKHESDSSCSDNVSEDHETATKSYKAEDNSEDHETATKSYKVAEDNSDSSCSEPGYILPEITSKPQLAISKEQVVPLGTKDATLTLRDVPSVSNVVENGPNLNESTNPAKSPPSESQAKSIDGLVGAQLPIFSDSPPATNLTDKSPETDNNPMDLSQEDVEEDSLETEGSIAPVESLEVDSFKESDAISAEGQVSEQKKKRLESDTKYPLLLLEKMTAGCSVVLENNYLGVGGGSTQRDGEDSLDLQHASNEISRSNSRTHATSPSSEGRSLGKTSISLRKSIRSSPRQICAGTSRSLRPAPLTRKYSSTRGESALNQQAKDRKKCINATNGCSLVLPPAQLSSHHLVCEYTVVECPTAACNWNNIAKKLCPHIREGHRGDILSGGADSKHTVLMDEMYERQHLSFLREVSRKLFVITVHSIENNIFAVIQHIAACRSDRPLSATGTLEVVDSTGVPTSWRGPIRPYQQTLSIMSSNNNCLKFTPQGLDTKENQVITFHAKIEVHQANRQPAKPVGSGSSLSYP